MVVLESGGMLTTGANQYLQPDYLSPLPTTLDAKKSPLALLAQTCSQIGADTPAKPLSNSGAEKPAKKNTRPASSERPQQSPPKRSSPASAASAASASASSSAASPPATSPVQQQSKLAFKPYEANVLSRREDRPPSKASSAHGSESEDRKSTSSARKSSSPNPTSPAPKATSPHSASPVIRSGFEVLQGHPKDLPLGTFKSGLAGLTSAQLAQLCCPPGAGGYDPSAAHAGHPAFRPPFAGSPFSHQHAAALIAAGYHNNPYITYQRVKTSTGGETVVPICKDPYCNGCQFSMHNTMLGLGSPCPAGCTQCEHQKYALNYQAALGGGSASRPYVCSWIVADSYCGKRFSSSDELLQHLRTHTAPGAPSGAAVAAAAAAGMALGPSGLPSPSSYSRYHPYAKPPAGGVSPGALLPPSASPFSAFNPAGLAGLPMPGLGPYYSPYALYGQRMGAAVHP